MSHRKAIVLGGTGLIGNELIQLLIKDDQYNEIRVVGRRNTELKSDKIKFYPTDLSQLSNTEELFRVDVVFCCLGTTMKTAGSKEAFRKVDFDMVLNTAKAGEGKAKNFIMISSLGAKAGSGNFYLNTKGEIEREVTSINIPSISILRPSILMGNRKENRMGEKIGIAFMKVMGPLLIGGLKKYRGNDAMHVAKAMLIFAKKEIPGVHIYESLEIEETVKQD